MIVFGDVATHMIGILGPIHYYTLMLYHSNDLQSSPNRDHVQKLCPWEVDISTNHLQPAKLLVLHILGSCLGFLSMYAL